MTCSLLLRVKALHQDLAAFEAGAKELQKSTLSLSAVRRLFDQRG
ncbi:hypothetical protein PI124_g12837 [Phytophthora idaei]|nr:hypothetical protein PI126_g11454 [Phytophthora idaei]KAG3242316.1 hypothetical protein PI124_g12837 [Phytophthora idaei]